KKARDSSNLIAWSLLSQHFLDLTNPLDFAITNRSQLAEIKAVSNYWKHETANTQEARQRRCTDKKGEAQRCRALGIRRLDSTTGWYSKTLQRLHLCYQSRSRSEEHTSELQSRLH